MMDADAAGQLLVFGYSCRLFRDDAKAACIDRGETLIPWMGQADHPIDRYDGRGHLTDLKAFESSEENDNLHGLSQHERDIEVMCDQERYRSLHQDECEQNEQEEEEAKRQKQAQVAFQYDYQQANVKQEQKYEQPSLRTLANCIEKTAEFIVTQGAQMEILMRAKEANNPKFQFLNPDNPYHPIYKQVMEKKKNRPKNYVQNVALAHQASLEVEKSLQRLVETLPTAAPRVGGSTTSNATSSGSAYSQLVERIRVNQQSHNPTPTSTPPPVPVEEKQPEPVPVKPDHVVTVTPPPITLQPLIDRTAFYAAKHGIDKLSMLKKHASEKFSFLLVDNKYNRFFQYKMTLYKEMLEEQGTGIKRNGEGSQDTSAPKFPTLKGFFH